MFANYLSYKDKSTFATWEAMLIGRLHCLLDNWERAAMDFSSSGGFVLSDKISKVSQETLILWGENDGILEPTTALRFQDLLPKVSYVTEIYTLLLECLYCMCNQLL
jgi:pimeloyl-ACP methyl ester carboxylesterase